MAKSLGIRSSVLVLTTIAAVVFIGGARTPLAIQHQDSQQEIIRAAARLVEISVIVQDRHGNSVTNLTAEDFTVSDGGQPQQVFVFQMHVPKHSQLEPLPEGRVTNRMEQKGVPSGVVTVILLDGLNTRFEDIEYSRNQVVKFLGQLRTEDRVAIVALSWRSLRILHDFTSDSGALLRALQGAFRAAGGGAGTAGVEVVTGTHPEIIEALHGWVADSAATISLAYARERGRRTARALEAISYSLMRVPGRKNLIWISSGFPLLHGYGPDPGQLGQLRTVENLDPLFVGTYRALNNASIAIYPVDARGLVGPFDPLLVGPPRAGYSREDLVGPGAPVRNSPNTMRLSATQDVMVRAARATGGRHFINTNDIAGAIRTAIDESRVTYTLGYYPTHGKWDGSYREIQVRVNRPGVTIRHRRGYYAFPDPPATPETIEEAMLAAAVSPLDATAIGLTAQMTPQEGAAGQRVTLTIEPEDVPLRLEEGRRRATLDVWYVLLDEEGAPHSIAKYPVEIALDEAGWRAAQATGIREERYMEFPAETRALRIVVRDRATGTLGSLRMPLPQE